MKRIIGRCYFVDTKSKFLSHFVLQKTCLQIIFLPREEKGGGDCFILSFKRSESLSTCVHPFHLMMVSLCSSIRFVYAFQYRTPPPAMYYLSIHQYYLPPTNALCFTIHVHIISLSHSLRRGKGMLAKESCLVADLRFSTMLSSFSLSIFLLLFFSLSLNEHNSH